MDPGLYTAAKEGNVDRLEQYNVDQLEVQVTPNNNTVLHIAALFGNAEFVGKIITRISSLLIREGISSLLIRARISSLLLRANAKGDTALHVAAREGHYGAVQALIENAESLDRGVRENVSEVTKEKTLRATNEDGDTALHHALRYQYSEWDPLHSSSFRSPVLVARPNPDVIRFLIEKDPEFTHKANKARETPLYLAVERGYNEVVSHILETCSAPAYGGPYDRTALHAAVISNNKESTKTLLNWKKDLAEIADEYGWTPLHYAARFGFIQRAKELLDANKSIAYLSADKDDSKTALHVAASRGHVNIMRELISQCPDSWEMVNGKGQNILHVAVQHEKMKVIEFIVKNPSLSSLINQKDVDGNTPLHLLVTSRCLPYDLIHHPRLDVNNFNKENWTPLDELTNYGVFTRTKIIKSELKKVGATLGGRNAISEDIEVITNQKEALADYKKMVLPIDIRKGMDTHLIVAALIATVTFTAGFTIPGGYNGNDGPNQGMAILTRDAAFKAFVVINTIALMLSTSAVFIYFRSCFCVDKLEVTNQFSLACGLVIYAMLAMVGSFITGTYAVLAHSTRFAITVCAIGCTSYVIHAWGPLWIEHRGHPTNEQIWRKNRYSWKRLCGENAAAWAKLFGPKTKPTEVAENI